MANFRPARDNLHSDIQVPVWAVLDYTETRTISRELLLVKVSTLGQEYLDAQLLGGPTHAPVQMTPSHPHPSKLEKEAELAHHFEASGHPEPPLQQPLTPSEALRRRYQHLQSITTLAEQFNAKIVDVSEHSVIVELTAKTTRVEAFLSLLKPFGILEAARTGDSHCVLVMGTAHTFYARNDGHASHTYHPVSRGRRVL